MRIIRFGLTVWTIGKHAIVIAVQLLTPGDGVCVCGGGERVIGMHLPSCILKLASL